MTGADIVRARRRLFISQVELARILVVDQTTVYRWEQSETPRIDPLQRELVLLLVGISRSADAGNYGAALGDAVDQGATCALHVLLSIVYGNWSPNAQSKTA